MAKNGISAFLLFFVVVAIKVDIYITQRPPEERSKIQYPCVRPSMRFKSELKE